MSYNRIFVIIYLGIFSLSCEKELNISEFIDDFNLYTPELRIEALILPNDTTAIVRIDKTFPVDEDNLYNCLDDNNNWNYYYCSIIDSSFEALDECQSTCTDECERHLFICYNEEGYDYRNTYLTQDECITDCINNNDGEYDNSCITDDLGEDGYITEGLNGEEDPDTGELDGIPTCGEPNVDEYAETLPYIHLQDGCNVSMTNDGNECEFFFNQSGGEFYQENKDDELLELVELINYGAWRPAQDCNIDFRNFNTEYEFNCHCTDIEEYAHYGNITAKDTLREPVVFFMSEKWFDINENDIYDENDYYYDWNNNNQLDTLSSIIDSCSLEISPTECIEYYHSNDTLFFQEDSTAYILYASLATSDLYQAVQYAYDEVNDRFVYYHGHPASPFETLNETININGELVIPEEFNGATLFNYEIFTFSTGYRNYYQYSGLSLDDPERTNLRDQYNNPVMGAFGSMSGRTKYFKIIIED